ncbi:Fur family ferric uptake transcriptional regulator [Sporomusaceae bacterium BoRhaA]|uniref:Fur family transcriptional regulator n=1 Tax=Pelorhabdus rhamnosifermentans TaxID=2772457 RepID=UPI001C06192D|nr:Fur family transcriptional regulator [Pelorhabdus rhamnosifermentans]MBU2700310.1 Fur family ferric uptake transcriptional regulator [Pelorhabdus rhamnosifermentans]
MEQKNLTDHKEYLNKHGMKSTKQRNLIFNILNQARNIMTAEDIYLELRKANYLVNLSTVYRILDIFVDKGIALKSILPEDNKCVFELNRFEHKHHLICLKCKKIISIDKCPLTEFERHIEQQTNFNITNHKLEMYGYCNNCKESAPKST